MCSLVVPGLFLLRSRQLSFLEYPLAQSFLILPPTAALEQVAGPPQCLDLRVGRWGDVRGADFGE
jgi:hypothetical protein